MQKPATPLKPVNENDPWSIQVTSVREEHENDPNQPPARESISLQDMLDKYSITLGYQNAHLLEIVVVLMTTGKVCVEFRTFNERLQLANPTDIVTRPAAAALFDSYLVSRKAKTVPLPKEKTQRITVQLPKINLADRNLPRRAPPMP